MPLNRSFVIAILAASLVGGVVAQGKVVPSDDEVIFTQVEQALVRARSLSAARITVQSRDGFVTLTGFAPTMDAIATAGRLAAEVHGVTGVRNRIRVADRAWRA